MTSESYLASEAGFEHGRKMSSATAQTFTGLETGITNTATYPVSGIRITIDGFYDKMPVLTSKFASVFAELHIKQVSCDAIVVAAHSALLYSRSSGAG